MKVQTKNHAEITSTTRKKGNANSPQPIKIVNGKGEVLSEIEINIPKNYFLKFVSARSASNFPPPHFTFTK